METQDKKIQKIQKILKAVHGADVETATAALAILPDTEGLDGATAVINAAAKIIAERFSEPEKRDNAVGQFADLVRKYAEADGSAC